MTSDEAAPSGGEMPPPASHDGMAVMAAMADTGGEGSSCQKAVAPAVTPSTPAAATSGGDATPPPAPGGADRGRIIWEGAPSEISPGLDFHNGRAYATVVLPVEAKTSKGSGIKKVPHLITSDRELIPINSKNLAARKIVFREGVSFDGCSRWSLQGIRKFVQEGYAPAPIGVVQRIVRNLLFYLDFPPVQTGRGAIPPSSTAWLMALIIVSTWFKSVFAAIGYLHLSAAKGSGKTKSQRILAHLTYLGELILPTTTTAALKRLANIGCSLLLDEIEGIGRRDFDPDKRAILLSGNTAGSAVWIMEKVGKSERWESRRLVTYGFRSFSNISEIDDVLGDRIITVRMVRSNKPEVSNRDPETEEPPTPWQELVDDLYAVSLLSMQEVKGIYDSLTTDQFRGREWQIWRPVLSLAKWLDVLAERDGASSSLYDEMVEMALVKRVEKQFIQDPGLDYWVLKGIVRAIFFSNQSATFGISPDDVRDHTEVVNPDLIKIVTKEIDGQQKEIREHLITLSRIGRIVHQLQILDGRRSDGGVQRDSQTRLYYFDPILVKDRATSYGIQIPTGSDGH